MNVKVINLDKEYLSLLGFFYPSYSILQPGDGMVSNFIVVKDVKSKAERDTLDYYYSNGIVVSTQIFDEVWDENKLKEEAIAFMHRTFKSRKKTVPIKDLKGYDFVEALIKFMFTEQPPVQESSEVLELFSKFGSKSFDPLFVKLCAEVSVPQITAAMFTFLNKICRDTNSIFYKKKQQVYFPKIKKNFQKAYNHFRFREKDRYGLSFLKFYQELLV